jgi:hypothetical protein
MKKTISYLHKCEKAPGEKRVFTPPTIVKAPYEKTILTSTTVKSPR